MKRPFVFVLTVLGLVVLSCGPASEGVGLLPTLAPTAGAPELDLSEEQTRPASFSDVSVHEAAMRPGFESDVDAFAEGTRYFLDVDISSPPYTVIGQQTVRYVNNTGDTLSEIVFRLYPNHLLGRGSMLVESVTIEGEEVRSPLSVGDSVLTVRLPEPLASGDETEIGLLFGVAVPPDDVRDIYGRLGDSGGVLSLPSFFPLLSVYDAESGEWWRERLDLKGDPVYSESALFEVRLTTPDDVSVATVGQPLEQTDNGDGTTDYHIVTGPVRDFAIYLSEDYEVLSESADGVTVNVFSLPGREEDDAFVLDRTRQSLEVFDREFGEYPFAEVDVVETPTLASGIEYPGLYVLADDMWDQDIAFAEIVIIHEMAHQWWYSLVGNDQVGQPWLDEGMAQYAVEVFYRETEGPASAQGTRNFYFGSVDGYLENGGADMPVGLSVEDYTGETYRLFVYLKAPLLFDLLEETYGEEAMRGFLHDYYDTHKYGVATTDGLLSIAEDSFGDDLDPLFDEWVR